MIKTKFPKLFRAALLSMAAVFSISAAQTNTPISQIQGEGNMSPLVGKSVTTRGIVTAIVSRGFYIQTPDAEIDADTKTSEGIYVFTSNDKPNVSIGSLVEVSGTVTEYRPERERYSLTLTEITRPQVKTISKDNPLPAPIVLTSAELNPQGKIDQMERFEGMRVKVNELNVVAPTGGFTDEKTGEAKSDGVFFGVIAGTPRPFREAGIEVLTLLIDKLPQTTPIFDMNPELIRVASNAQTGAKAIDVTTSATVKNLTGVVDYFRGAYTLLPDAAAPPAIQGNKNFVPVSPAGEREVTVASFNLENFFDDERNSDNVEKETVYSKEHFQRRLAKTSLAIRKVLSSPDVLAVIELENLKVLKKLADKVNADAVAEGKPNPNYVAYLEEGNDGRGIDCGYLIKSSKVKVLESVLLGKKEKIEGSSDSLYDRPPFLIRAEVADAKTGKPLEFTVIVNHFKSYGGIDDPRDGNRVRQKRRLQAEWLANFVAERAKTNPTERMLVVGDFNSFQFNDGYNDLIGILKGKSDANVIAPSTAAFQTGLLNLSEKIAAPNRYSYSFDGSAQILDHILINKAAAERVVKFGYARFNADFPEIYANDAARPERVSDHDVPVVFLSLDVKAQ